MHNMILPFGLGSSPLTRGKPGDRHGAGRRRRLIPAHAGKTMKKADAEALKQGSSPLTRGKPHFGDFAAKAGRLIPAHAGKTYQPGPPRSLPRAHPRSRGENPPSHRTCTTGPGSSPLTRGKPRIAGHRHCGRGLIPAHAGKTFLSCAPSNVPRAHPRSRGENGKDVDDEVGDGGSSPLTRGKRGGRRKGQHV